jgi:peptide/nickel transport system substrate-binding protein
MLPISFKYFIADSGIRGQIAERIVASLAECGIQVTLSKYDPNELYQPAPDGVLFGRQFDLAQLAWQLGDGIPCEMFTSGEMPTQNNFWLGEVSGGANFIGYANSLMDQACQGIRRSGLNEQFRLTKIQEVMNLIAQDVPLIPLYFYPQVVIARTDICGLTPDHSYQNFLQDLERVDYGESCQLDS